MMLTPDDHLRIAEAVAVAERGSRGEIRCVLARESADYGRGAIAWAAGSALVLPAVLLLLAVEPEALARLFGGWTIAHLAAQDNQTAAALAAYVAVQGVVFLLAWGLASWAPLRRRLTPSRVAASRVHAAALEQFAALGLHRTRDHTGVLIYASLAERRAEVLADEGIYARTPPQVWDEVVDRLVAGLRRGDAAGGFVEAISRTGEILADCLPPRDGDRNELPDGLIERP